MMASFGGLGKVAMFRLLISARLDASVLDAESLGRLW